VNAFLAGLGKTWQWLAPEVIDADSMRSDERADIYSFGIILWEILTRQYPFSEFQV
jgi:serine/threonine protein kinase